jgi:NADH:ubiquinone oxidoreductase subunit 5 (subunit L)/multisubunit Na+/H+ antiporter MnhA subunit
MQANKSSILAVVANKLGDIALLIGASIIYYIFKSTSFYTITNIFLLIKETISNNESYNLFYSTNLISFSESNYFLLTSFNMSSYLEIAMILFIIACIGKSAQFGFHF